MEKFKDVICLATLQTQYNIDLGIRHGCMRVPPRTGSHASCGWVQRCVREGAVGQVVWPEGDSLTPDKVNHLNKNSRHVWKFDHLPRALQFII